MKAKEQDAYAVLKRLKTFLTHATLHCDWTIFATLDGVSAEALNIEELEAAFQAAGEELGKLRALVRPESECPAETEIDFLGDYTLPQLREIVTSELPAEGQRVQISENVGGDARVVELNRRVKMIEEARLTCLEKMELHDTLQDLSGWDAMTYMRVLNGTREAILLQNALKQTAEDPQANPVVQQVKKRGRLADEARQRGPLCQPTAEDLGQIASSPEAYYSK